MRSFFALEAYSPLTGHSILLVDLTNEEDDPSTEALAESEARLRELPCPTIAFAPTAPGPVGTRLLPHFDVVIGSETDLDRLRQTVDATPLAAAALVQLLRHSEKLGVHDGLIAESWVYSVLQSGPEFAAWRTGRGEARPREANPEPAVVVHRDGARLELTLNRPEKHNAFSAEMRDALSEALQIALSDPSIAAVILRGRGPSFSAGGDLDEFGTLPDPATAHAIRSTRNAARLLAACADRVEVEIHGACVGAGIELPAFAHRVRAREDTVVRLPEVAMGLVPGAGGTVSVVRRIGRQRTAYLALTGLPLEVGRALEWGLVDEVFA